MNFLFWMAYFQGRLGIPCKTPQLRGLKLQAWNTWLSVFNTYSRRLGGQLKRWHQKGMGKFGLELEMLLFFFWNIFLFFFWLKKSVGFSKKASDESSNWSGDFQRRSQLWGTPGGDGMMWQEVISLGTEIHWWFLDHVKIFGWSWRLDDLKNGIDNADFLGFDHEKGYTYIYI